MKAPALLAATYAVSVGALSIPALVQQSPDYQLPASLNSVEERYLIDVGDGVNRWVTDEQKWALRREGINFMDITENQDLGSLNQLRTATKVVFPDSLAHQKALEPKMKLLSKSEMRKNLEKFTSFHTRYYKSEYGVESSNWLYGKVKDITAKSHDTNNAISVRQFDHSWGQASVIATIPGRSNKTVVVGAHQDSINLFFPSLFAAPGADDDGSGTVTILEALRTILTFPEIVAGNATNTLEFHWYSAEEGGLLGSQAIFQTYEREARDVRAMLQQDMTGYVQGTLDAGKPESVGVITDFVDKGLTEFIKKTITGYCDIPYVLTKCGYACSDHASASKAGYPSAFVIESDFSLSDKKIHTTEDKIEFLSFDHMLQHAKLTLGFAYELAFADL